MNGRNATILEKFGHGGDLVSAAETYGIDPERILDFSANINPLGPPPKVMEALAARMGDVVHYPDPAHRAFRRTLAKRLGVNESETLVGNGAAECMALAMLAYAPKRVGVVYPCFSEYTQLANQFGAEEIRGVYGREAFGFQPDIEELQELVGWADLVFIGHPNNPTGSVYRREELVHLAQIAMERHTYLIIDEAFLDFLAESERLTLIDQIHQFSTTILIRSMTKMYAIPGLRLGYAIANEKRIEEMRSKQVTWSVNAFALTAGERCLAETTYEERTRSLVRDQRERLAETIQREWGWNVWPGRQLFVGPFARTLYVKTFARLVATTRRLDSKLPMYPGLGPRDFRIAVLNEEKNDRLLQAFADFVKVGEKT